MIVREKQYNLRKSKRLSVSYLLVDVSIGDAPAHAWVTGGSAVDARLRVDGKHAVFVDARKLVSDEHGLRNELTVIPGDSLYLVQKERVTTLLQLQSKYVFFHSVPGLPRRTTGGGFCECNHFCHHISRHSSSFMTPFSMCV